MNGHKTILIITTIVAIGGLVASGTWFTYQNYKRNHAPVQPTISQEQLDQTAAELAKQEAERLEEIRANLPPIKEQPTQEEVSSTPDDTYVSSGSDVEVERPEFSKPEPPPPPSVPEEELKDPTSKPEVPKQPDKPSQPKDGQMRDDTDGDGLPECYMKGFGWQPYSPGGTYENAPNAGTGDIIGY